MFFLLLYFVCLKVWAYGHQNIFFRLWQSDDKCNCRLHDNENPRVSSSFDPACYVFSNEGSKYHVDWSVDFQDDKLGPNDLRLKPQRNVLQQTHPFEKSAQGIRGLSEKPSWTVPSQPATINPSNANLPMVELANSTLITEIGKLVKKSRVGASVPSDPKLAKSSSSKRQTGCPTV